MSDMIDGVGVWAIDMGETDWIAATSREEAIEFFKEQFPGEWSGAEIEEGTPTVPENLDVRRMLADVDTPGGGMRTFREILQADLAAGKKAPFHFGATYC